MHVNWNRRALLNLLAIVALAIWSATPLAIAADGDERGGTVPNDANGKPLNLGFETGTLKDWKVEGGAFVGQPIEGDAPGRRGRGSSQHVGKYWIGGYEKTGDAPTGTLTSVPFKVEQPWASFLIAGGPHASTRVEIVSKKTGAVIFKTSGDESENMKPAAVDLRQHLGEEIFIRVVDDHNSGWGHVNFDDFRFHATKPNYTDRPSLADDYPYAGLPPQEAARVMEVPPGFAVTLFAGEPDVEQPIAMAIDDRGRLWVAEAFSYPIRLPEDKAHDRILIFEDVDQDGKFDKRTVFTDNLNLVSGLELGFGGVWVGAAPHLLFIPDKDGDDRPDGPPQVMLDGWAYQDTHETLNSFMWGPDGWLYGCHGVFTHSRVGKPGTPDAERTPIDAGIWRYHPLRHEFELFAEGTSNPWGIDFNERGQAFETACVIPHLYHMIQGGRFERQAGQHFNPYTYDDIKTIAKHRHYVGGNPHGGNGRSDSAGGGHAHAGAMLYLGAAWPEKYRDQIFMNNIHGARINQDQLAASGSGYFGDRAPDFLLTKDSWSQILYLTYGPDGQVYMIDWYDRNQCHHGDVAGHDRSNGRIFKVSYDSGAKVKRSAVAPVLKGMNDAQLVELLLQPNDWYCRHARRQLQERAATGQVAADAKAALRSLALTHADETRRLRGLWALHAIGADDADLLSQSLKDKSPYVRGWAIQLACETGPAADALLPQFVALAQHDPSPIVRLYLASAVRRLPTASGAPVALGLIAHAEDQSDHNLPLMDWYAVESIVAADTAASNGAASGLDRAFQLLASARIPRVRGYLIRRLAQIDTPEVLGRLVTATLAPTVDAGSQHEALAEMNVGLQGGRRVAMPDAWPPIFARLVKSDDAGLRSQAITLATTFGDPSAIAIHRATLLDRQAAGPLRLAALAALAKVAAPDVAGTLQSQLEDPVVRAAALRALAGFDDPATPAAIFKVYAQLDAGEKRDALATLASRVSHARQLLVAMQNSVIPRADISADVIRQLRNLKDSELEQQITSVWGAVRDTPADKAALIAQYKATLSAQPQGGNVPDLPLGRAMFVKTCQQCHTLFGVGGKVGPELTGSNRANLDYVLANVIDPSALVGKDYQAHVITTNNGRILTGLVQASDAKSLTLATANETLVIPRDEIDDDAISPNSMMPDDLVKPLSERELRSLVAYLASPQQTAQLVTPETVAAIFNGRDLTLWQGDMKLWRVDSDPSSSAANGGQAGEIVGQTSGLAQNEFLRSELIVADFRFSVQVKLVNNEGNSGIQLRSEVIGDGDMRGYQADIGSGWWGKLYEEQGRGILSDKSGEQYVKLGDWNDYVIEAVGTHVRTWINGNQCVDIDDPVAAKSGRFAFQLHAGGPTEVRFRNLKLELPTADGVFTSLAKP